MICHWSDVFIQVLDDSHRSLRGLLFDLMCILRRQLVHSRHGRMMPWWRSQLAGWRKVHSPRCLADARHRGDWLFEALPWRAPGWDVTMWNEMRTVIVLTLRLSHASSLCWSTTPIQEAHKGANIYLNLFARNRGLLTEPNPYLLMIYQELYTPDRLRRSPLHREQETRIIGAPLEPPKNFIISKIG